MCRSMVDIPSEKAENRRGKKTEETTAQKYNGLPYNIGRPFQFILQFSKVHVTQTNQWSVGLNLLVDADLSQVHSTPRSKITA